MSAGRAPRRGGANIRNRPPRLDPRPLLGRIHTAAAGGSRRLLTATEHTGVREGARAPGRGCRRVGVNVLSVSCGSALGGKAKA